MKTYSISTYILTIITFVTLILTFSSECGTNINNIYLGIFCSSSVSMIISLIGYYSEKKKTLKKFIIVAQNKAKYLNTYIVTWPVEKKCQFYIDYCLQDFYDINEAYDDIYFMICKKSKDEYELVYEKLKDITNLIYNYYFEFSWFLNGTGKTKNGINEDIQKIEIKLLNKSKTTNIFYFEIEKQINSLYSKIVKN